MNTMGSATNTKPSGVSADLLMTTFKFSASDVTANQQGILSNAQRAVIQHNITNVRRQLGIWGLVVFAICLVIALVLLRGVGSIGDALPVLFFVGIFMLAFVAIGALFFVGYRKRLTLDLEAGTVAAVKGQAKLTIRGGQGGANYVTVQTETFQVQYNVYRAFRNGVNYIIYYLPHSRKIVSVETV